MKAIQFLEETVRKINPDELTNALKSERGTLWVDFTDPTEADFHIMAEVFQFHPLALEDTRKQKQRPKIEEFADHLFLVLKPFANNTTGLFHELDVFIGRNFLVTVHPAEETTIEQAQQRFDPTRYKPLTSSFLLYILLDVIMDNYFPVLERIEAKLEGISDRIINRPNEALLEQLAQLRHTLNEIGRFIRPQREIINVLTNHEWVFITQTGQYHLRDVSDHLFQITDMVDDLRGIITDLVNLYMSSVSHRLNRVVTRLTAFTIIIGTLSIFTGFYGMNFVHTWPPFDQRWGLPIVVGGMLLTVSLIVLAFRRRGWF